MINIRFGEYLMITAYAVTSAFTTDGDCVTVSGTPTTLPTPFDVITDVEPSAGDPKTLQSIIMSGFVTWLHHTPTCSVSQMCFEPACLFNDEFYVSGDSHPAVDIMHTHRTVFGTDSKLLESEFSRPCHRTDRLCFYRRCLLSWSEALSSNYCSAKGEKHP